MKEPRPRRADRAPGRFWAGEDFAWRRRTHRPLFVSRLTIGLLLLLLVESLAPFRGLVFLFPCVIELYQSPHRVGQASPGFGGGVFVLLQTGVRFEQQRLGLGVPCLPQADRPQPEPPGLGVGMVGAEQALAGVQDRLPVVSRRAVSPQI